MRTDPEESLGYDNRKRKPDTQDEYAICQHDLCCQELGLEPRHDREGDTLLETVCRMKREAESIQAKALEIIPGYGNTGKSTFTTPIAVMGRMRDEIDLLRAELKKSSEALEANITTFIDQREQIQEAREIAEAMRRGSIQAEYFQTHPFPWETPARLDSENEIGEARQDGTRPQQ